MWLSKVQVLKIVMKYSTYVKVTFQLMHNKQNVLYGILQHAILIK